MSHRVNSHTYVTLERYLRVFACYFSVCIMSDPNSFQFATLPAIFSKLLQVISVLEFHDLNAPSYYR